nr:ATP-binding protein [Caulobacter hibisci]
MIASLRRPSAPIALQIVALLVASLVVAQLATLALTLLLPPKPPAQHSLADIAAALKGGPIDASETRPLVRTVEDEPPSLSSPGWVASEKSSADLARMLNADPDDVRLLFYAPPPFAGAGASGRRTEAPSPLALLLTTEAHAQVPAPGGRMMTPPGGGMMGQPSVGPGSVGFPVSAAQNNPAMWRAARAALSDSRSDYRPGGAVGPAGAARYGQPQQRFPGTGVGGQPPGGVIGGPPRAAQRLQPRFATDPLFSAPFRSSSFTIGVPQAAEPIQALPPETTGDDEAPVTTHTVAAAPALTPRATPASEAVAAPPRLASAAPAKPAAKPQPQGRPLAAPVARGLFGLAPAPYIEGDFVAAVRVGDDRWVTLQPKPEGFPNSWQRRVLLWFLVSFAVVGPIGYIFARRLAAPLAGFADAAEALGRDPSSPVLAADGPAEVGRAARAFNQMQARLTRFINDRTAMIGAISHDLRTPLTRMRFRLERATPALRREIGQDIDQMEAMINSVLAFMRENAEAGPRQHVDLRSLLECVVDDAEVTGGDVALEPGQTPQVEIDVLGLQRVFTNLVDNAVKYGDAARVSLYVDGDEAVAEIRDRGPGMSEDELKRVFTPFYRSVAARTSTKQGVGLGLATSRSTVRAHGGDIRLANVEGGLMAQVRLPLAAQRGGSQTEPPVPLAAE